MHAVHDAKGAAGVAALLALTPGRVLALYYRRAKSDVTRADPLEALTKVNARLAREGKGPIPSPDWFWPAPE